MSEFQWPWEYTFPPFFTLQVHEETRNHQLKLWANIFLKYLRYSNKFDLNINDNVCPLFYNESINRRLSPDTILRILEHLQSTGHATPVSMDKSRTEWQVFWYTLEEYGAMVYNWIQETGQTYTVCTLYEVANAEDTEFYGIDEQVLVNALRTLEVKGKCELISMDDSYGVKFF